MLGRLELEVTDGGMVGMSQTKQDVALSVLSYYPQDLFPSRD